MRSTVAHRAGSEAGARAVGDAEIHRHPDQRDVEPAKIRQLGRLGPVRQVQQGRNTGKRHRPPVIGAEHQRQRLSELGGRDLGFLGARRTWRAVPRASPCRTWVQPAAAHARQDRCFHGSGISPTATSIRVVPRRFSAAASSRRRPVGGRRAHPGDAEAFGHLREIRVVQVDRRSAGCRNRPFACAGHCRRRRRRRRSRRCRCRV